ncbi:MAG: phosphatase PAP2 family protein [Bacteroidota bacterium]
MIKNYVFYLKENTSKKSILIVTLVTLGYLVGTALLLGLKTDKFIIAGVFNVLYYVSVTTRKFVLGFSVFVVFWIIFDSMKAFPNYKFNPVHVEQLYNTEKQLFGINVNGTLLTPNEYLQKHTKTFLDVLTGFFYLNWMPVPLLFAFYLFRKNKQEFIYFSLAFLFVNLLGFVVYYTYPAAPPWYVEEYGFTVHFNTPGNTAGLSRFDDYFGINLFRGMYAKSSNVFAAMPSLHSAYPTVVFYFGVKNKLGWINALFALLMAGIWFSAVYSNHHYILDVLAGIACALTGLFIFHKVLLKNARFMNFVVKYKNVIS